MLLEAQHRTGAPHCAGSAEEPLALTHQPCCLCHREDAEAIAVGEDFEYRTSPDTFAVLLCRRCSLVYLSPRPAVSELERIYPQDYHAFQFSAEQFGLAYRVRSWLEARRLLECCQGLPHDAKILDIGCGDGFHIRLLQEFGKPSWRVEGIDASERAVAAAQRAGLPVRQGAAQTAGLEPESYDLILLIATIEHVEDPVDLLLSVRDLLNPGGRVVMVTDNTGTLDFQLFQRRHWGGYHFPRHWNLFNKSSLERLAAISSMQAERIETIVSPVNWVYSIRNWLVDRQAPAWCIEQFSLKTPLTLGFFTIVDNIFQLFGKGALLRATFRKPD
jgi:2-polyprenyl-3-methyl-5-hydroxy-6-metoxy-1,4-benzoquinol methylase